jgi:hypothetical protein
LTTLRSKLTLSQLIDLEVALEKDREQAAEEVRTCDEAFLAENGWVFREKDAPDFSARLIKSWTEKHVPIPSPGQRFVSFLSLIDVIFVCSGLLFGGSAALVLLQYDGAVPINVLQYLGVFVLLQLIFLLLLSFHILFGLRLGVFQDALKNFAHVRSKVLGRVEGGLTLIRNVRKVYSTPESWLILKVTQHFAIAFQFSALIVTLSLVGSTDLAFGWSSTLNLSAETLRRLIELISTPWSWLGSEWTPSIEQIRDTQFFRLENRYVSSLGVGRIGDVTAATSWWRFLIAAHVTYGLLPRVFVLVSSEIMLRRSLRRSSEESFAFSAVQRRLLALDPSASAMTYMRPSGIGAVKSANDKVGLTNVIVWRDLPAEDIEISSYLALRGIDSSSINRVGGMADDVDGSIVLASVKAGTEPWVILVEDWESPGKGFKNLVKRLRLSNSKRVVYVVLVKVVSGKLTATDDSRNDLWRRHIHSLSDASVWLYL